MLEARSSDRSLPAHSVCLLCLLLHPYHQYHPAWGTEVRPRFQTMRFTTCAPFANSDRTCCRPCMTANQRRKKHYSRTITKSPTLRCVAGFRWRIATARSTGVKRYEDELFPYAGVRCIHLWNGFAARRIIFYRTVAGRVFRALVLRSPTRGRFSFTIHCSLGYPRREGETDRPTGWRVFHHHYQFISCANVANVYKLRFVLHCLPFFP